MRTHPVRRLAAAVITVVLTLGPPGRAAAAGIVRSVTLDGCCAIDEVQAAGGLVVLVDDGEAARIERVDLRTGATVANVVLSSKANGDNLISAHYLAVADGSVWLSMYYADVVYRLNPTTLHIQAAVPTGRSPSALVYGGGSLWAPLNHNGAVVRIDPRHNAVTAVVRVGRQRDLGDEPVKIAWNGTAALVSLPGSGRVAHIAARDNRVRYDHIGTGPPPGPWNLVAVPDGYWIDTSDGGIDYYHWSTRARAITAHFTTQGAWGAAFGNGALYTGGSHCSNSGCTHGFIEKHDPSTGALLATRRVNGNEAWLPHVLRGFLWTADLDNLRLLRSPLF